MIVILDKNFNVVSREFEKGESKANFNAMPILREIAKRVTQGQPAQLHMKEAK